MASFIKTQRGSEKLIFEGFSYNLRNVGNFGKSYWRCDQTKLECLGTAVTDADNNVKTRTVHNHKPNPVNIDIKVIKNNIKEAAACDYINSADIIEAATIGISDSVKANLPATKQLQKMISRKRSVGKKQPVKKDTSKADRKRKVGVASFITTQRGSKKLLFLGYSYNMIRKSANKTLSYWRCDESILKCTGSAITNLNNIVTSGKPHNHDPCPARIDVKVIKNIINEAALRDHITPRDIVDAAVQGLSDSVKTNLPKLKNLVKTVLRKRKAAGLKTNIRKSKRSEHNLKVPETFATMVKGDISELEMLEDSTIGLKPESVEIMLSLPENLHDLITLNNEKFVLQDTGEEDINRIIILGCMTDIHRLTVCDTWFVDSISNCPSDGISYHLWIIYGIFLERIVPFIYTLLPNKQGHSYERVLKMILEKVDEISPGARPTHLIFDFDKAKEICFTEIIPEIRIRGSFFHYSNLIWQKIKEFGLLEMYENDEYFKTLMKSFAALAFIPPSEVVTTFESLADELIENFGEEEAYHNFIDYFVITWIGRIRPRRTARFALDIWSCNDIILEELPHITNSAEAWNRVFSTIYKYNYNNLSKLIAALLKEQESVESICMDLEDGEIDVRPAKQHENEMLFALIQGFENTSMGDFLRECINYIHFSD